MKNIHVLQTDKAPIKGDILLRHLWKGTSLECISWWRYNETTTLGDTVVYSTLNGSFVDTPSSFKTQHIYITSDEEIKVGDWTLMFDGLGNLFLCDKPQQYLGIEKGHHLNKGLRKIILTTDQDLIKDSVQAIDDEFLEWFVNNPSCGLVEVVKEKQHIGEEVDKSYPKGFFDYKIIIPKEEPKQETIEQAAERLTENAYQNEEWETGRLKRIGYHQGIIEGAKWQLERMYSDVDMINYALYIHETKDNLLSPSEWLKQVKKK